MRKKNPQRPDADARYWRLPAVVAYTGRSRSRIYADPAFPKPIKIGANTSGWIADEVRQWAVDREVEAGRVAA